MHPSPRDINPRSMQTPITGKGLTNHLRSHWVGKWVLMGTSARAFPRFHRPLFSGTILDQNARFRGFCQQLMETRKGPALEKPDGVCVRDDLLPPSRSDRPQLPARCPEADTEEGQEGETQTMARQVANAASNAACFSTKLAAVWIMRTVKSDTESLGGHSRIPLQSALGRRGEPGKRSSQPGNSPTRDEKRLGNSGFQ
jgi:hypothetical protein